MFNTPKSYLVLIYLYRELYDRKFRHLSDEIDQLQRGLDPTDKATRVANYADAIKREVGLIANSAGVMNPSDLALHHAFSVGADGAPLPLDKAV